MKKTLLTLIVLAFFGIANAQIKEKGTIEITPKIGYSFFQEITDDGKTDSNSGVAFGATADYYFNSRWSLRSGLLFNKMGGRYSKLIINNNVMVPYSTTYYYEDKLNYVSIPLNANWHFGSTRKWNLNFGASPSFLLSAKMNDEEIPSSIIKSFQLGLSFGIGYKIEINQKFGILIDYQVFSGLTNISNVAGFDSRNAGDSINIGAVIEL
ncbi:porin family protein [Flavobacterium sp.]|uniref:porin family protein n=1 Tax=Flavobacterium sp. TaxID=239 RepID=UPI002CE43507|nr:porin family protein [Flavobacterium sp.]HSD09157.1 porin family protein [Flavobacterium sp.]